MLEARLAEVSMSDLFPCDLGGDIEVIHDVEMVEIEMDCDVDVDSAPYERLEIHHDIAPFAELDESCSERAVPIGLSLGAFMRSPVLDTLPFAPIEPAELATGTGPVACVAAAPTPVIANGSEPIARVRSTEAETVPYPRSEIETVPFPIESAPYERIELAQPRDDAKTGVRAAPISRSARVRAATVPRVVRVARSESIAVAKQRVAIAPASDPPPDSKPVAIASLDTHELARFAAVDALGAAKLARVARVVRASTTAIAEARNDREVSTAFVNLRADQPREARESNAASNVEFRPSATFEAAWFANTEDASATYDAPPRRVLAGVLVIAGLVVALGAGIALALAFAR